MITLLAACCALAATAPAADPLRDYPAAHTTVRAGFAPVKAELVWGEPAHAVFTARNTGHVDFTFWFGGDYRGAARHNRFKIAVRDAATGALLSDWGASAAGVGGRSVEKTLKPGEAFDQVIDLAQFRTFAGPGRYTVDCAFAFDADQPVRPGGAAPVKPVVSSHFELVILARTPARVAAVLDELADRAVGAPDDELPAALAAIAAFGKEDAVARLIKLAGAPASPPARRAAALRALAVVPTEPALDALAAALKDSDAVVRAGAARALGATRALRAVKSLLGAMRGESPAVTAEILLALGDSKAEAALPPLLLAADEGEALLRDAAVAALAAHGSAAAVAALKERVTTAPDLHTRYRIARELAETVRVPLEGQWLAPILAGRELSSEWIDVGRLARMYAGDRAVPTLLAALDFDVAWSHRNWWVLYSVQPCGGAPAAAAEYVYDPNRDPTAQELEKNRAVLAALRPLAGPRPATGPAGPPARAPVPLLVTDPPIAFAAVMEPVENGAMRVRSGFLVITLYRNGSQYQYDVSDAYRALYAEAGHAGSLLQHRDLHAALGVTPAQATRLLELAPVGNVNDPAWHGLFWSYREAPADKKKETLAALGEAVRAGSQAHHQATEKLVRQVREILTEEQVRRVPALVEERQKAQNR